MLLWPAQLIPELGLDQTEILFGLFALLSVLLVVALLLLLRTTRRRKSAATALALKQAQVEKEATQAPPVIGTDATTLAEATVPATAPIQARQAPIIAQLFSTEKAPAGLEVEVVDLVPPAERTLLTGSEIPSVETDAAASGTTPTVTSEVPPMLISIGARTYLEQVNQHVLLERGRLVEEPGKLALSWATVNGPRSISIVAAADKQKLSINGIPFEASPGGVRKGIVASLKSPDNS